MNVTLADSDGRTGWNPPRLPESSRAWPPTAGRVGGPRTSGSPSARAVPRILNSPRRRRAASRDDAVHQDPWVACSRSAALRECQSMDSHKGARRARNGSTRGLTRGRPVGADRGDQGPRRGPASRRRPSPASAGWRALSSDQFHGSSRGQNAIERKAHASGFGRSPWASARCLLPEALGQSPGRRRRCWRRR